MLEEVTSDTLTEEGGADGAINMRVSINEREKGGRPRSMQILTSRHCGGCEVV